MQRFKAGVMEVEKEREREASEEFTCLVSFGQVLFKFQVHVILQPKEVNAFKWV